MRNLSRVLCLTLVAAALTACATTPPPSLTPPPAKKLDAKTQLESGQQDVMIGRGACRRGGFISATSDSSGFPA